MGHFRDGVTIGDTLKAMKARPHRLNDVASEIDVSAMLALVRDLKPAPGIRYRHAVGQVCRCCGSENLYAKGTCKPCWQMARYYASSNPTRRNSVVDPELRMKRQSELAT
jgi:hypothetical protein